VVVVMLIGLGLLLARVSNSSFVTGLSASLAYVGIANLVLAPTLYLLDRRERKADREINERLLKEQQTANAEQARSNRAQEDQAKEDAQERRVHRKAEIRPAIELFAEARNVVPFSEIRGELRNLGPGTATSIEVTFEGLPAADLSGRQAPYRSSWTDATLTSHARTLSGTPRVFLSLTAAQSIRLWEPGPNYPANTSAIPYAYGDFNPFGSIRITVRFKDIDGDEMPSVVGFIERQGAVYIGTFLANTWGLV